jgi:hypothetical protein
MTQGSRVRELVGPEVLVELVHDPGLEPRRPGAEPADGGVVRELPPARERVADLGHPEPGAHAHAEPALELFERGDHRRHDDALQRCGRLVGLLGFGEDHRDHRPDEPAELAVVAADVVPVVGQAERLAEHEARAVHVGGVHRGLPGHVVGGIDAVVAGVGPGDDVVGQHAVEVVEPGPRDEHALRGPGRSRGVDDRGDVVVLRALEIDRGRGPGQEVGACEHAERQRRRRGGEIGDDHQLELGQPVGHRGQAVEERLRDDEDARLGVGQQVPQHLAAVPGVGRHLHRAQPGDAEPGEVGVERVREHRRDVLVGGHAEPPVRVGPQQGLLGELVERHLGAVDALDRGPLRCLARATRDEMR